MSQLPFVLLLFVARFTFSLICKDVEFPENKILNLYELKSTKPENIVNCLSFLGKAKLALDDAKFIWNSIVDFHNGIENIPEEVLVSLQYVTIAIQPDEYSNITLDNIDVIRNFGFNYGLSNQQLEAIAERVREDFGQKQPEDYTVFDLTALGQILCAFNKSEIDRIHIKAYKEAAAAIGKLENCRGEIMQGFADLAIQDKAFGPALLWTNKTFQTVGVIKDYLPMDIKNELQEKFGANNSSYANESLVFDSINP